MAAKTVKTFRLDKGSLNILETIRKKKEQTATDTVQDALSHYWQVFMQDMHNRKESFRARKLAVEMMNDVRVADWAEHMNEILRLGVTISLSVSEDEEGAEDDIFRMLHDVGVGALDTGVSYCLSPSKDKELGKGKALEMIDDFIRAATEMRESVESGDFGK